MEVGLSGKRGGIHPTAGDAVREPWFGLARSEGPTEQNPTTLCNVTAATSATAGLLVGTFADCRAGGIAGIYYSEPLLVMIDEPSRKTVETESRLNLSRLAKRLGLEVQDNWSEEELNKRLSARKEQIEALDWGGLMDIVSWGRHQVPTRPDKLAVAQIILSHKRGHYQGLSHRGWMVLAVLRNVRFKETDSVRKLISRLQHSEGLWGYVLRKRDRWLGSMLSDLLDGEPQIQGARQPANSPQEATLREHIEQKGIIEGLGSGLRGAADGYLREKMEEIEARIDYKLDEIDERLAEWRDRELTNRLRMIKITLVFSVVIALLSLLYTYMIRYWKPGQ